MSTVKQIEAAARHLQTGRSSSGRRRAPAPKPRKPRPKREL